MLCLSVGRLVQRTLISRWKWKKTWMIDMQIVDDKKLQVFVGHNSVTISERVHKNSKYVYDYLCVFPSINTVTASGFRSMPYYGWLLMAVSAASLWSSHSGLGEGSIRRRWRGCAKDTKMTRSQLAGTAEKQDGHSDWLLHCNTGSFLVWDCRTIDTIISLTRDLLQILTMLTMSVIYRTDHLRLWL